MKDSIIKDRKSGRRATKESKQIQEEEKVVENTNNQSPLASTQS